MKRTAITMAAWRCANLLSICIPSLIKSKGIDDDIFVCLNEPDIASIELLKKYPEVIVVESKINLGPVATDIANHLIENKYDYWGTVNTDMVFQEGCIDKAIEAINKNYPCTISLPICEPGIVASHVLRANLGEFVNPELHNIFNKKCIDREFICSQEVGYNHPLFCKTKDMINVGGYSNNYDSLFIANRGRAADDYFPWRLLKMNPDYKFIRINESFCYHGVSLNSKMLPDGYRPGHPEFELRTGITIPQFRKLIKYPYV